MSNLALQGIAPGADAGDTIDPAAIQEGAAWVGQLMRTLKTCRLYDEANPTVVRFREDLAGALTALLAQRGALRLEVGSSTLAWSGHPVHTAQSRDDNLAGVLHRDGIRLLVLEPGIEAHEVGSLVDQLLAVTGPSAGDDDLVTLLWDANLPHVVIETVPIEGDADGGPEDGADRAPALAWPKLEAGAPPLEPAGAESASATSRSDDCLTGEQASDLDRAFDEIETAALFEIARFQEERSLEEREELLTGMLRLLGDCLADELTPGDREEFAAFIPRVVREALVVGDWHAAATALRLVRACDAQWSGEEFAGGLCGSSAIPIRRVVGVLDQQDAAGVDAFLAFGREFGPSLADWLMRVLAESQQMRVRRPLTRTIADLLAGQPDRVLPCLSDGRWYVVRNVVHILGWIGGNGIIGGLQTAAGHPEPRVRREVVAALSRLDHDASRPILTALLASAEPELFGAILGQLALDDDPSVAETMLGLLRHPGLRERSEAERRALFLALASRGETVLPALESELNAGGLFSRRPEPDRKGIALCISRIGTPAARAILQQGVRSRHASIRKACLVAGASGDPDRD